MVPRGVQEHKGRGLIASARRCMGVRHGSLMVQASELGNEEWNMEKDTPSCLSWKRDNNL